MKKRMMIMAVTAAFACAASADWLPLDNTRYWNVLLHLGANFNTDYISETNVATDQFNVAGYGTEAGQRPFPGLTYTIKSKDYIWTVVTNTASSGLWTPAPNVDNYVKYWFTYLYVPGDATRDARFIYRCDDDLRVLLDGVQILSSAYDGGNSKTQDITLTPGFHRVLIKLHEGGSGDHMGVRITDRSNVAYTDILYSMDGRMGAVSVPEIASRSHSSVTLASAFVNRTGAPVTLFALCAASDLGTSLDNWLEAGTYTVAADTLAAPVSIQVAGLSADTPYYVRLCVTNASEQVWSAPLAFTTFGNNPAVVAKPVENLTGSRATATGELLFAGGYDTANVTLYWGEGESADAGDTAVPLGERPLGPLSETLAGLDCYQTYHYRFYAEIPGDLNAWSPETVSFTVPGAPALGVASATTEIANRRTVLRSELLDIGGAPVTVTCNFGTSPGNLAPMATWSGLTAPQSFVCTNANLVAGTTYYYAFNAVNQMENGRTFSVWTATNSISFANAKTWTGNGDGTSWNDAANWDGAIPTSTDTAVFGSSGITSGKTIALNANQVIYTLAISSPVGFTIGSADDKTAGFMLTLTDIERAETAVGTQTFGAPVRVLPDANGQAARWRIDGGGVSFSAPVTTASAPIMKTGAGSVTLDSGNGGLVNLFTLREGVLNLNAGGALNGNLYVGGGTNAATVNVKWWQEGTISGARSVTVASNGVFNANGGALNYNTVATWKTEGNGRINLSISHYPQLYSFRGGQILGGTAWNTRNVESFAHHTMALLTCSQQLDGYNNSTWNIERGTAPIDLRMTGGVAGGSSSSLSITKRGHGVLQFTSNIGTVRQAVYVDGGTLLFDNTAGSGNGNMPLQIRYKSDYGSFGTVGGRGFLGGTVNGHIVLKDGNAANLPTLAPGTIDETTGDHVIGTLTVGSTAQTNNVAFNNYSRLRVTLGPKLTNDKLAVYGAVTIGANTTLEVNIMNKTKSGVYTLVTATEGVTGHFASVLENGKAEDRHIRYTETEVQYILPPPGAIFIVR